MKEYKELLHTVLTTGKKRDTRNGNTLSTFGQQMRFDLTKGFPILTTKKMPFKLIYWELIWFLKGNTNIKFLLDKNVNIWNKDAYRNYVDICKVNSDEFNYYMRDNGDGTLSMYLLDEFIDKIKTDDKFALKFGDLGCIYGAQWRKHKHTSIRLETDEYGNSYNEIKQVNVDQIQNVINSIITDPASRRHIVSAWDVGNIFSGNMALPPCHLLFQFYVDDEYLDLQLLCRSQDLFLGTPFNITSYALLLEIIAKLTGKIARTYTHIMGDTHIYEEHIEQCKLQLTRDCLELPSLEFIKDIKSIDDVTDSDELIVTLQNYKSHGRIKAPLIA